jgi:hypothetical protein
MESMLLAIDWEQSSESGLAKVPLPVFLIIHSLSHFWGIDFVNIISHTLDLMRRDRIDYDAVSSLRALCMYIVAGETWDGAHIIKGER